MTVEEMMKMDEIRAEFKKVLQTEKKVIEDWIYKLLRKQLDHSTSRHCLRT